MNSIKDLLASIGTITLLALGMTAATAGAQHINQAFDRSQAGHDAMIAEHKAYLASDDDHYVTDPMNGFDEEVALLEQAEKDAVAAHANAFLAKVNGGDK